MDGSALREALQTHPALSPELLRYLSIRTEDAPAWSLFTTQHLFLVRAYPYYLRSLFPRLDKEQVEILRDVLIDVSKDGEWDTLACDSEEDRPMSTVNFEVDWVRLVIDAKPLPEVLGVLALAHPLLSAATFSFLSCAMPAYDHDLFSSHVLLHPSHDDRFNAILEPYMSRSDLILRGARQALDFRLRTWNAIETAITTQWRREAS